MNDAKIYSVKDMIASYVAGMKHMCLADFRNIHGWQEYDQQCAEKLAIVFLKKYEVE